MKKSVFVLLMAAALSQSCAQKFSDAVNSVTQNFSTGETETREMTLGNFSGIETSSAIKATVVKSDTRKIVIRSNAMQFVEAKVKNGKLSVGYKSSTSMRNAATEVTIYTPGFSNLQASSTSKITVADGFRFGSLSVETSSVGSVSGNFEADEIKVNASSTGRFSGNVKTPKLRLAASSTASIEVSGEAKSVDAAASSTAKINLENLRYNSIQKNESSMGKVITK